MSDTEGMKTTEPPTIEELLERSVVTTGRDTSKAEETVRKEVTRGYLNLFFINGYSAIKVFVFHLISLESIFSIGMSVGFTLLVYFERQGVSTMTPVFASESI